MARYFEETLSVIIISLVVNIVAECNEHTIFPHVVVFLWFSIYGKPEYKEARRNQKRVAAERISCFGLTPLVEKKEAQIVNAGEERKHRKAIQRLKDENNVVVRFPDNL